MKHLIANEFKKIGFNAIVDKDGVIVFLNRHISTMEVVIAYHQIFECDLVELQRLTSTEILIVC
jgi:hypothetical protein